VAEASLYRRHRPQSFDAVVGQEHVVRTLRNAVERDRVHHAYLFVGSRGTGKTSMAKILARSLNCVNGPTVTPCGECESCRQIALGTSLDVIEMDAASNRSVDDIRDLRERVGYVAAAGRWKVYILDEAHMLTREAWNAFLKTLEEPPPMTVFVLATTEPHKVMPTIVDRCQRFDFQRPSAEQVAEVIRRVGEAESLTVEPGAVAAISRGANGSFRDALGTLDQLCAYCGETIGTDDALAVLGVADAELIAAAADAIAAEDGRAALEVAERLAASGRDVAQFGRDLVDHLRRLLVVATAGEVPEGLAISDEEAGRLADQANRVPEVAIVRSLDVLSNALAEVREGDEPRMTIEVALLRCARPQVDPSRQALAERLERLEARLAGEAPPPPPNAAPPPAATAPAPATVPTPPEPEGEEPRVSESPPPQSSDPAPERVVPEGSDPKGSEGVDIERITTLWPGIVDHVRQSGSELLSAVYEVARPLAVDVEESVLRIGFPPSAAFNKRKAEAQGNRERFAEAVKTIVGERLRPVYVLLDEEALTTPDGGIELTDEELIEQIKSTFDAEEILEEESA
jgi:DNA polymerase-3 subunit gamma/tau